MSGSQTDVNFRKPSILSIMIYLSLYLTNVDYSIIIVVDPMLNWLHSYCLEQLVKYVNFLSNHIYVPSRVPQGSHFGSIFFLIFINYIYLIIHFVFFSLMS